MSDTMPVELMPRKVATMDGKPSIRQADEIFRRVREIQAAEGLSNARLARMVGRGCSSTTWSQVKNGNYGGDCCAVVKVLAKWLADRAEHAESPTAEYVATTIGANIAKICHRAWQMPCMGLVITPSGAGKTMALRHYVRGRGNRAMLIQAGEVYASRKGLLRMMAEAMGLPIGARSYAPNLYGAIRRRLADVYCGGAGNPYFIAVDEATTLSPPALNMLRNLHDDETCRPAIVLADTARLDAELHARRGIAGGYEQLRSRMGAVWALRARKTAGHDAEIIGRPDVVKVADSILAGLGHSRRLARASYDYLYRVAQNEGTLRRVLHRLHAVHDFAAAAGSQPAYDVSQLDWVAPLVGAKRQMEHGRVVPFGAPAARRAEAARRAG